MTGVLSEQQRQALTRYWALQRSRPDLLAGRARRPIVTDRRVLSDFALTHEVVLGVVAETPYLWLINDLVQSRNESGETLLHTYLRVIAPPDERHAPGVVVIATVYDGDDRRDERIVLVEQERHATGGLELEVPRGFREPDIPPATQALDELRRETGYLGEHAEYLGTTLTDSGTTDRAASFFHVVVSGKALPSSETQEAIAGDRLMTRAQLWRHIDSGEIRDAFTVQALALYERRLSAHR